MTKLEEKITKTHIVHLNVTMIDIADYVYNQEAIFQINRWAKPISRVQAYQILNYTVIY